MRRNIELKARLADLAAAREVSRRLATDELGVELQTDTYFRAAQGRLKLREREGRESQLIWYSRPDLAGPKASDYLLVSVADPAGVKSALAGAWGIWLVVEKRREIFLVDNVRIHLDQVSGLGDFLEFEAVLGPGVTDATGHQQLSDLARQFGIDPADHLEGSYSDLLAAQSC